MTASNGRTLIADPHIPWDGPFPYTYFGQRLVACGCPAVDSAAPSSTVHDEYFDVMAVSRSDEETRLTRGAWDALRKAETRLLADFFMYEAGPVDLDSAIASLAAQPLPVLLPDFIDLATGVDVRPISSPAPQEPRPAPPALQPPGPVVIDVGALAVDLIALTERL